MRSMWIHCISYLLLSTGVENKLSAQERSIGDTCPDVSLKHIMNFSSSTAKLSDFKNKLIILDFWGTGCMGCIESFPKIEALQKRFGDSIQIIMINKESEDSTKRFFEHHKKIKLPSVPFVTEDTILASFFPHAFVPHEIWMNDRRVVYAITGGYNLSENHIRKFLRTNKISLSLKKDISASETGFPPTGTADSLPIMNALYYSYIMPVIRGLNENFRLTSSENAARPNHLIMNDVSVLRLLQVAFGAHGKYDFRPRNAVKLEVADTFKYTYPSNNDLVDQWESENSYLYELKVPFNRSNDLYTFMQQDLKRFFNLTCIIKKQTVPCWVLVKMSNQVKLDNNSKNFLVQVVQTDSGAYTINKNLPFSDFVWRFKDAFAESNIREPFINATGLPGDLKISYTDSSFAGNKINALKFKEFLHQFNLDLVKKNWPTDVLIVKENE